MLRGFTKKDVPGIVDLVVAAGLFTTDDSHFLIEGLAGTAGTTCVIDEADDDRGLAAVILYRPEEAADRVFDLTMLAVRPDLQGQGRGAALMHYAEQDLRGQGQRMLVVRTSGTAQYDGTRAFYRRLGYSEHTRVPDYWADGDDLVMFSFRL